jgi:hypothetical protein
MSSSSRKRQTFAKLTRERTVKERRARKQEKREEKKQAAAAARDESVDEKTSPPEIDEDEVRRLSRQR